MASSSSSKGEAVEGRPIPLVIAKGSDEDSGAAAGGEGGMFVVGEDAMAALRKFDGPIAVVAIVGLYRTGKSFIAVSSNGEENSVIPIFLA